MGFSQALFTFDGRMKRMEYFLYSLLIFVIMFGGIGIAGAIGAAGDGGAVAFAIILGLIAFVVAVVGSFAIGIKRLHDMGMSGLHMIWIYLVGFASGSLSATAPGLGIICSLVSLGAGLWLLFAPSVGDNQWGPKR